PLRGRQGSDEIGEELRRNGRPAVSIDLAGNPVRDPDLQVRRGELETGILGPDQDVGKDRERAASGDRPAGHSEAASEVLLHDGQLHVGSLRTAWGPRLIGADRLVVSWSSTNHRQVPAPRPGLAVSAGWVVR